MTASSTARQRRKQHAPARKAGARGNPKRGSRPRSQAARPQRRAPARRQGAAKPSLLTRLRQRWAERRAAAAQRRAAEEALPPREWPRRLGVAALKLGSVVVVAWALLLAGREVYEYATTSPRFEVRHFIYEPTPHLDDDQLRELLAIEPGTNILACELPELSERIAAHPWVAQAIVTRNLPDTLQVEVVEHTPEAIVLAERFYLVNGEGKPFKPVERGERGELPIITGIDRALLAEQRDVAVAQIERALDLLRLYRSKQRPKLGEIHLDEDGSITLYTASSGTQLLLGRGEFEARLDRWDALRAALGERADRLAVVHLDHQSKPDRRDRVVARFANERDEAVLLAQAASEPDTEQQAPHDGAEAPATARRPVPRAKQRNRIPRYE
ncbi:MAG: FtsQ-type POTRA domain-containing protein [Enhygromyxa sp.]